METCIKCTQPFTADGIGTGYGIDKDGNKVCYQCCAESDRAYMVDNGKITLYLTEKGVTNWPGTLVFPVFGVPRKSRNNFGAKRLDAWFVGPDRHIWHAVNIGDNEIARCKRTKETWVPSPHGGYCYGSELKRKHA
jgi:hypothetical protein